MIPERIQAIFDFIDFLDANKQEYMETYIPLCEEISELGNKRSQLKPDKNYKDKLEYEIVQTTISEKFQPITENIYKPVASKLMELGIWTGDDTHASIWNNNFPAIADFKTKFAAEDVPLVISYKNKYLDFRKKTNSNFLSLQMILADLDEVFKALFDFFKDTEENEFNSFEAKTIEVNSIEDAVRAMIENKGRNVKYSIPHERVFSEPNTQPSQSPSTTINNHFNMGDNINVGDITGNSGNITIGKDIRISESFNDRKESSDKISELIGLIRQENISEEQMQSLVSNFEKVKEELLKEQPVKERIYRWLSNTKKALENLVLTHDVTQAIQWLYSTLNFTS